MAKDGYCGGISLWQKRASKVFPGDWPVFITIKAPYISPPLPHTQLSTD